MLTSNQLPFGSGLCSVQARAVCVHMEAGSRTRDVQHLVVLDRRVAAPAHGRGLLNLVREVLGLRVGKGLGLLLVVRAVLDAGPRVVHTRCGDCLLSTSDAADDLLCA